LLPGDKNLPLHAYQEMEIPLSVVRKAQQAAENDPIYQPAQAKLVTQPSTEKYEAKDAQAATRHF